MLKLGELKLSVCKHGSRLKQFEYLGKHILLVEKVSETYARAASSRGEHRATSSRGEHRAPPCCWTTAPSAITPKPPTRKASPDTLRGVVAASSSSFSPSFTSHISMRVKTVSGGWTVLLEDSASLLEIIPSSGGISFIRRQALIIMLVLYSFLSMIPRTFGGRTRWSASPGLFSAYCLAT